MNVEFTPEQELLRSSARDFLARACPMSFVRQTLEEPRASLEPLWHELVKLGWTGLVLPEAYGGAGLGAVELAIVLEESGRALLPGPLLPTIVAGWALALGGDEAQRARWLPRIADGRLRASLAQLEPHGGWGPEGIALPARRDGDGFRLAGIKRFAPEAQLADLLLVPARTGGRAAEGIGVFAVDARAPGVAIRELDYLDLTRRHCEVTLSDVRVERDAVLGDPTGGWALCERVADHARVALCAEMCGGAAAVLERCVAYARTREQFGRPIGSFQAIQHRCADMLAAVEGSRSVTYYAAWALDAAQPDAHALACLAKAYCSDAFARVAAAGIQLHGGLGFTWEQDPHLFFRRAKSDEHALGDARWHRELAARALWD
jgi:alkylation response protein AidB-like acyl-CoA dehydrogenase